ncbi:hypothetical protein ACP275_08G053500 [Erythranthe tilingii]
MGLAISRVVKMLFAKREIKILMVGLDSAGKTTILYKSKLEKLITTIPTIEIFKSRNCGLIFVVDSNDNERVSEDKDELHRMLDHSSCATSGQGLYEGLDWLCSNISN